MSRFPVTASSSTGITAWYAGREPRERQLLCLCAVAIAAFVIWLGLYRPLQHWHSGQAAALAQARSQHLQTADQVATLVGQPAASALLDQWQQAAANAGLGISHQTQTDGQAHLQLAPAPAVEVLRWLDALPAANRPQRLQLERHNGLLQATLQSADGHNH